MTAGETHRAIEATFRIERARLIAGLARLVRNVDLAEELAQDALVVALSEWPRIGVPANPGAWLMALAKRRAIDALRRDKMRERKHEEIARTLDETFDGALEAIAAIEAAMDDNVGDELLGLIFTACHPILSRDARAALTLRVVGGLTTDEIARAFLSSEATIASPRSMTGCASWRPRPWSISIARSPTAWPSGPKRASDWWTRSAPPPPSATMRPCRRRGATFCSGPADWPRRVQNSRLRPR